MKRMFLFVIGVICLTGMIEQASEACMVFRLKAEDGTVLTGRAMEFAQDLHYDIIVVPRNMPILSPGPRGGQGLSWKTRYGYVGVAQLGNEYGLSEGMNEKGVTVSELWFELDMKWQDVPLGKESQALAGPLVADWILGNLDGVADIERELANVRAFSYCAPEAPSLCPTLHFNACDATGACKVIEYEDGALRVYDNPLGVMTNGPRYPWHMANLRQYVGITSSMPASREWSHVALRPTGHGAGMFGLPGDLTPPSRFVRLAAITQFADPQPDARHALNLAQHIMNDFDIVFGMISDPQPNGKPPLEESTQWSSFSDLTNRVFYFRTYDNLNLRRIDFKKLDFSAPKIKRIPMFGTPEAIVDVAAQAR